MTPLPSKYSYLSKETGPPMLVEGLKNYGELETPGPGNNPVIMGWAKELGLSSIYTADAVPWCGLFIDLLAKRSGYTVPASPLWALSWAVWGTPSPKPMLGDVLVFKRPSGGHVALYVAEDKDCFHILGGNQGDKVGIIRILKSRLFAARRPLYTQLPINIRSIVMDAAGIISQNEA